MDNISLTRPYVHDGICYVACYDGRDVKILPYQDVSEVTQNQTVVVWSRKDCEVEAKVLEINNIKRMQRIESRNDMSGLCRKYKVTLEPSTDVHEMQRNIAKALYELSNILWEQLTDTQKAWYWSEEEPLIRIHNKMEQEGIHVNVEKAKAVVEDIESREQLTDRDHTALKYFGQVDQDGKTYPEWDLTGSRTGRIVSGIQNLKKEYRELLEPPPGYTLIKRDWSQAQLRVLAGLSQDPTLVKAFQEGQDLHQQVADQVDAVEDRQQAKVVNFGIPFGITGWGLAQEFKNNGSDVSIRDCNRIIAQWSEQYPRVTVYLEQRIKQAEQDGFLVDSVGRRRYFFGRWTQACNRQVKASVAQLEESALLRQTLVRLDQSLRAEGLDARIYWTVHDSICIVAREDQAPRAGAILQEIMDSMQINGVPMVSETE